MVESSSKSARQQQIEKNENQIYLESNELNKLMETLMGQIRQNKPDDIVSASQLSSLCHCNSEPYQVYLLLNTCLAEVKAIDLGRTAELQVLRQ